MQIHPTLSLQTLTRSNNLVNLTTTYKRKSYLFKYMEGRNKSNATIGGGSSRNSGSGSKRGGDIIRKGPWKEEEDEVLINHVKKYGPRDWSSIRSKGLLQRTGKSCRLRWVNKLRPNLKNGCKFSADEERIVIELQAIFGNKWARIATYLPGRTDNDVKNFWSSRQKRLARLLQSSASASSSSSSHKSKNIKEEVPESPHLPLLQGSSMSSIEKMPTSKAQPSLQSHNSEFDDKLPPLVNLGSAPQNLLESRSSLDQLDFPLLENYSANSQEQEQPPFPQFPQPGQEFLTKFDESEFINALDTLDASDLGGPELFPSAPPLLDSVGGLKGSDLSDDIGSPEVLDASFDDFPTFMLDDIEPLRCPPKL